MIETLAGQAAAAAAELVGAPVRWIALSPGRATYELWFMTGTDDRTIRFGHRTPGSDAAFEKTAARDAIGAAVAEVVTGSPGCIERRTPATAHDPSVTFYALVHCDLG